MGDRTRIDWCDASWNPVTGCWHGCSYCYASSMANRFKDPDFHPEKKVRAAVLNEPVYKNEKLIPYPFGFLPTFHRYRLDVPQQWKRPRNIFVCSMADLFGTWVKDQWIAEVLDACRKAPQHRYLFLTKNPSRYDQLVYDEIITEEDTNFWLGSTCTDLDKSLLFHSRKFNTFMSCEPMLAPWPKDRQPTKRITDYPKWVILGAETGNHKNKVVPEKEWIDYAVEVSRKMKAAVFMKESLRELMGQDFIQEFPWEANNGNETESRRTQDG